MSGLVSVVMPFRDAGETVEAALAGLLAEADEAREVLAIDDGSTDSGVERVRTWAERDPRVRLLANRGSGLVSALNTGLVEARGALIARMDADDVAHPERLSRQRAGLVARPELALLGTCVRAVSTTGGDVGEGLARYVAWQNTLLSPREHAVARFIESPLCHPSIMMRRGVLQAVGGYRDFDGPEDYELFLRLVARGHALAKLPEVMLDWRHREGRATFGDGRYAIDAFRRVKAPYLADVIAQAVVASLRACGKPVTRAPGVPPPARSEERCEQERSIVMWGAGATGRRLARELERHGVKFARFIDIDPNKIGRIARGVSICSAEQLDAQRDLVVVGVGARGARALIREDLTRRGFVEGDNAWFAS